LLFLAVIVTDVSAQHSQILYFMNLPQRSSLNPAMRPSSRLYIGLPGISDISFRMDNNFLSFPDLFSNGVISDSTFSFLESGPQLDSFLAGLNDKNSVEPQVGVQLFGLGFTVGKDLFVTFDVTERIDGNFVLPGDLLRLVIQGNESYAGTSIDLSSLRADFKYYHEVGLGLSKNITERIRVGVRGKMLFGVATASLDNNDLRLKVNDDYTHTLYADMIFNMSGPVNVGMNPAGGLDDLTIDKSKFNTSQGLVSLLTNAGNPGMGLDLGIDYRITDRISVSGAITDLGFIRWKSNRIRLYTQTEIEFNGLTLQDVYDESVEFDDLLNWTLDSLQYSIYTKNIDDPFTTFLPFGVTAAASYSPVKAFTVGLLSQTRFIGRQVHESFTLSANMNLWNALSASCSYTAANQRYDNLGAGLSIRGGWF
ncbi:MAG: hypothetical protein IH593_14615, partial [Bacteroidales bacterium]|nr:hypothetical protein [Bacteroidales bacterium]